MDAVDYLRVLRRGWKVLVVFAVLGTVIGFVTAPTGKTGSAPITSYRATRTMLSTGQTSSSANGLAQAAFLIRVGDVPKRVAARFGGTESPAVLASQVSVKTYPALGALSVTGRDKDPERATQLANAFGEELVASFVDNARQSRDAQTNAILARLDELQKQVRSLDARLAGGDNNLVEAERNAAVNQYRLAYEKLQQLAALGDPAPSFTTVQEAMPVPIVAGGFRPPASRTTRVLLGAVIGLVAAIALILLRERFDTRVRTKQAAEGAFGLPVIAEVPALRKRSLTNELVSAVDPASPYAEAYRSLRTAIMFVRNSTRNGNGNGAGDGAGGGAHGRDLKVILVTSPGPGEGKTTTVGNLAAAFSEAGQSVLVLSCDFRRPRIHRLLGVEGPDVDLADVLRSSDLSGALRRAAVPTTLPRVALVASGADVDNPAELVTAERGMVTAARELADMIIIDTPPLLAANDASELMACADVAIIVAKAGKTTRESSDRAAEMLARLEAPTLGVVLVAAPAIPTSRRYYYRYRLSHDGVLGWPGRLRRRRRREGMHSRDAREHTSKASKKEQASVLLAEPVGDRGSGDAGAS